MKGGVFTVRRQSRNKCYIRIVIIFLIIFSIVFSVILYKLQPVIMSYAVSVAETIMLNSANESIVSILEENNIGYSDIVNLSSNSEGYITGLEIDIYEINRLKSSISGKISQIIAKREKYPVSIPLGSFFGNSFTNGFGPEIPFNMHITTTAFVDFSHEFKNAGINQVLHIINVDIKINARFVIMGYSKSTTVSTSAIAAQTVIVGKTPDAFTNVIESETDNTGGLINDYGAISK